jgi:hypothetical protein
MPLEFIVPSLRIQLKHKLNESESENTIPSLRIQLKHKLNESESENTKVEQLLRLEEEQIRSMEALEHDQRLRKAFIDRHRKRNEE